MLHKKNQIEQPIQWKLNSRTCSFWWDNLLGQGRLAQFSTNIQRFDFRKVADFWMEGKWNYHILIQQAPPFQWVNILAQQFLHINNSQTKLTGNSTPTCSLVSFQHGIKTRKKDLTLKSIPSFGINTFLSKILFYYGQN